MTLNFSARIIVNAEDKTKAIFDSVDVDNKFYPENPVKFRIVCAHDDDNDDDDDAITIHVESENLAHLRANLNSTLRLIQASYESIESVKVD